MMLQEERQRRRERRGEKEEERERRRGRGGEEEEERDRCFALHVRGGKREGESRVLPAW